MALNEIPVHNLLAVIRRVHSTQHHHTYIKICWDLGNVLNMQGRGWLLVQAPLQKRKKNLLRTTLTVNEH